MYGELKYFIKPFTRLETFSNSLNSHQKILQKIIFYDFHLFKCSFRLIKQESNSDLFIERLKDYFLTISIDRVKVLIDWKCCISNFHLENSRTWIFTLTILWNNIFQTQTSLFQSIHVYTFIYNNLSLCCNNICLTWLIFYHA